MVARTGHVLAGDDAVFVVDVASVVPFGQPFQLLVADHGPVGIADSQQLGAPARPPFDAIAKRLVRRLCRNPLEDLGMREVAEDVFGGVEAAEKRIPEPLARPVPLVPQPDARDRGRPLAVGRTQPHADLPHAGQSIVEF